MMLVALGGGSEEAAQGIQDIEGTDYGQTSGYSTSSANGLDLVFVHRSNGVVW